METCRKVVENILESIIILVKGINGKYKDMIFCTDDVHDILYLMISDSIVECRKSIRIGQERK